MNRQRIEKGQRIVHNLKRPLRDRLKSRKVVGPYIVTPPNATEAVRSFYLESDFCPDLRWRDCEDVSHSCIKHTGWFMDELEHDTVKGIVGTLPQGRGFVIGWTMGEGMASAMDTSQIFAIDEEHLAARAADSWAEQVAEDEREYREQEYAA